MLKDKVIIVTGSTGGIGQAICHSLAFQKVKVVAVGRNATKCYNLRRELNRANLDCFYLQSKLESLGNWSDLLNFVRRKYQKIDVIINCIGDLTPGSFDCLTEEEIKSMIFTNFTNIILGTKAILPIMKNQKFGHIINIGSIGGIVPMPFVSIYSATKFALRGFSFSLAEELKGTGIHISLISPGPVMTKMLETEAKENRATIAFTSNAINPKRVAEEVLKDLKKPRLERILPRHIKMSLLPLRLFPNLFSIIYPLLNILGRRKQKSYNKSLLLDYGTS